MKHQTLYFYGGIGKAKAYNYTPILERLKSEGYTIRDIRIFTPNSVQPDCVGCQGNLIAVAIIYYD